MAFLKDFGAVVQAFESVPATGPKSFDEWGPFAQSSDK